MKIFLFLFISTCLFADFKVGLDPTCNPFEFKINGEIVGFDIDLAKGFDKNTVFVETDFSSLIAELSTGKIDAIISCMANTKERSKIVSFSNTYYESHQTMILKKSLEKENLNNQKYTIGVKVGETGEQASLIHFKNAKIVKYESYDVMSLDLISGRIDGFIFDKPSNDLFLKEHKTDNILHLEKSLLQENISAAFRKNDKRVEEFNQYLEDIKKDGRLSKLERKWF